MRVLHSSRLLRGFVFFSVLLLAFALAPAASTGPQPEVACPVCGDHNSCTIDSCDSTTGFCRYDLVVCDDANPCTVDSCNPLSILGCRFVALPVGTACDDANSCSAGDTCTGTPRVCTGSLLIPGSSCDDNNACTHLEFCTAEGQCLGTPLPPGSDCNDQNACTSADLCAESPAGSGNVTCEGTLQPCEDGDPCTQDTCDPASGICGTAPQDCNDGNPCTLDACSVPAGGCVHTAQSGGSCEDAFFCSTGDSCHEGNCRGSSSRDCFDQLSCTDDRCIESPFPGHCQNIPDDSLCPSSPACVEFFCLDGPPPSGCIGAPLTGTPCSDSNPCTVGDVCSNGTCGGTPLDCNDGNACTADSCTGAGCAHSDITASCNDGNACTTDTCDPATGCAHQPNAEVCNGIDDDCDNLVDENRVQADCLINPSTLNVNSQSVVFSVTCKLFDVCNPAYQVPISGSTVSRVYVSRADSADNSSDDVTLPDPSTLPCPDPVLGLHYERGISENLAARDVSNANVTFKFNQPIDGDCSTLDGDRASLNALLEPIPDNTGATVCISAKAGTADFQACVAMLIRNK